MKPLRSLFRRQKLMIQSARSVAALLAVTVLGLPVVADEPNLTERGRDIFSNQCVACHGERGEGTPDVPAPLFGDRPTVELADLIARTMPEGSPEDCVGDEAAAVAAWMQQAFYSPEAQARLHPPRISLSRLTVAQYRNAVADLVASFRWSATPNGVHGLEADYYADRRTRRDKRVIERVDPRISFDFGDGSPDYEKINEDQFSATWRGSLIVRDTGLYDFKVRSENGVRLYLNDPDVPLIDAWVKSGTDTEFTGVRHLLGGRLYPITLEWFKFNEPSASIELLWTPPHGAEQVIPPHCLTPQSSPPVLVVESPFPPDDRSDGYERGNTVSPEWDDAATWAAVEVADKVVDALPSLVDTLRRDKADERERQAAVREFCLQFAERAFRRPLNDQQTKVYIDDQFAAATTHRDAVRRVVLLVLKSPRFLFRELGHQGDQFATAERLALALTNSVPDKQLLDQARQGHLSSADQIRRQAWRLVDDHRARHHLAEFIRDWLNLSHLHDLSKDSDRFPDFDHVLESQLRESLNLTIDSVARADSPTLDDLLLAESTWFNHGLAEYYGADVPDDGAFHAIPFETDRRRGVVTHPFLLSGLAYPTTSSPIHRGVMMSRSILGRAIKPPPVAVAPTAPELSPDLTTRERVTLQTSPDMCANCHQTINSLGFTLENFDAVGRFREQEKDKPIDSTGGFLTRSDETVEFRGPLDLVRFAAASPETHRSFTRQLFHHMVQQPVLAYGPDTLTQLTTAFRENELKLRDLMVEIAVRDALRPEDSNSTKVAQHETE